MTSSIKLYEMNEIGENCHRGIVGAILESRVYLLGRTELILGRGSPIQLSLYCLALERLEKLTSMQSGF